MIRESFPAMSVYETLFRFADAIKKHMGVARCTSQYRGSSPHNTDDAGKALGPQWFRGDSGLYHWCRLPQETYRDEFNARLFTHNAGISLGRFCDMVRRDEDGALRAMFRFCVGPLSPDPYASAMNILRAA
ncbi:MAG: hypothetical protein K0U93_26960 [Gammaproteobacteria bacterium]|nr:hypothetical protein [Gammaproteobacteria bacterium]